MYESGTWGYGSGKELFSNHFSQSLSGIFKHLGLPLTTPSLQCPIFASCEPIAPYPACLLAKREEIVSSP